MPYSKRNVSPYFEFYYVCDGLLNESCSGSDHNSKTGQLPAGGFLLHTSIRIGIYSLYACKVNQPAINQAGIAHRAKCVKEVQDYTSRSNDYPARVMRLASKSGRYKRC